nr:nad(p)h-dependent fmn reductase lot6 [Quercus suber]
MAAPSTFRVGIIIGSTRVHRVGPEVAKFVLDTITAREQKTNVEVEYDLIDLKTHDLPIFDEPGIPNQIESSEGYQHEHTRVWSRRIAACDAIVFTSAQRNWGIPAELKNAIDYLFHEWKGKPGMLVTFGGHGGEQVAMHLKMVLGAIEGYQHEHTRVWSRRIAACDAIVFTSAQRNWGIPAELKNAIDYLFHEWKGKPGMLVTFGGHGGEQVAMHLKMVLGAIGMRLVDQMVNMKFPSRDTLGTAFRGEVLGLDAANDKTMWAEYRADIVAVYEEMMTMLAAA